MNIVPSVLTRAVGRQVLLTQKHSPRILFVAGVAGAVTSTVLACKATLKLNTVLDELEYDVENVKKDLSETEHYRKDLAFVYGKSAYKIGRL